MEFSAPELLRSALCCPELSNDEYHILYRKIVAAEHYRYTGVDVNPTDSELAEDLDLAIHKIRYRRAQAMAKALRWLEQRHEVHAVTS